MNFYLFVVCFIYCLFTVSLSFKNITYLFLFSVHITHSRSRLIAGLLFFIISSITYYYKALNLKQFSLFVQFQEESLNEKMGFT